MVTKLRMAAITGFYLLFACGVSLAEEIGDIRVYFNHGVDPQYAASPQNIAQGNVNLEKVLIQALERARTKILVAVYTQNLLNVAEYLVSKKRAGLDVRVILDAEVAKTETGKNSTTADNDSYIQILRRGGVPLRFLGGKGRLMHHKIVIIDPKSPIRSKVITGSTNWTESGIHGDPYRKDGDLFHTEGDVNDLVAIEGTKPARVFEQEFERLWHSETEKEKTGEWVHHLKANGKELFVLFFPGKNEPTPCRFLQRFFKTESKRNAIFSQFVFSSLQLSEPFIDKIKNSNAYSIKGIFDRSFSTQYYSETLEFLGILGVNPLTGDPRAGAGRLLPDEVPNYMRHNLRHGGLKYQRNAQMFGDVHHQKVAILDGKHVVSGSLNFTQAGCTRNNENTVIFVNNPPLANQFEQAFYYRYNKARPVWNDID